VTPEVHSPDQSYAPDSDQGLLEASRTGDHEALSELWNRHSPYGFAVAQGLAPELGVQSLNTRAWCRLFDDLGVGKMDERSGFRPYLYNMIRSTAGLERPVTPDRFVVPAYWSLVAQEREVLWYSHIETMKAAQMAKLMGLEPRDVSRILAAGRANLRRRWLELHLSILPATSRCRQVWENSEEPAEETVVMHTCEHCAQAHLDAVGVGSLLLKELLPTIAGVAGGASLLDYLHNTGPSHRAMTPVPTIVSQHLEGPRYSRPRGYVRTGASQPGDLWSSSRHSRLRREKLGVQNTPARFEPHVETGDEEFSRAAYKNQYVGEPRSSDGASWRTRAIGALIALALIAVILVVVLATRSPGPGPVNAPGSSVIEATDGPNPNPEGSQVQITEVDTGAFNNLYPLVSGTTTPETDVTVLIGDQTIVVTSDPTGAWATPISDQSSLSTRGTIEARIAGQKTPATSEFDIALPPSLTIETHDDYVWLTMTGLPSSSVDILLDGEVKTHATLDGVGNGSGKVLVDGKTHVVQIRYTEQNRLGALSNEVTIP